MQFTNGNTTDYVYNAAGEKLSVTHQTAVAGVVIPMTNVMKPLTAAQTLAAFKTDYCGNVVYENGAVSKILTEEGYITLAGTTPTYHYYLKDHQGNNRMVINQVGTVEQVNHYYPFGGLMGESTGGGTQPYKYNGKELDRIHGLDLFDYGARHYDAALGRWMVPDPLAEKNSSSSPYVYVANNPILFVDPNGCDWYRYFDKENESYDYQWQAGKDKSITIDNKKYERIGATFTNEDKYYSLFGSILTANSFEGKIYQTIDEAIISYSNYKIKELGSKNANPFDLE